MTHTAPATSEEHTALSDRVVALLRTAVPAWWGTLAAWLLSLLAGLLPTEIHAALADLLGSEPAQVLAVTLAIAAWYALWRLIEDHVPTWLVRLALGSARTPSYALAPAPVVDGTAVITSLSDTNRAALLELRAALADSPGDPSVAALDRVLGTGSGTNTGGAGGTL